MVFDSVRLGSGWAADGPRPGYFPFYVGLLICIASAINFVRGLLIRGANNKPFVERGQLRMVLTVLLPTAIWIGAIAWVVALAGLSRGMRVVTRARLLGVADGI